MTTVEMTDLYRSLVANLKDKLGGTITEANADAIAQAAAQVYRREVEPRLWEEKSAHQLLDGLGVPRSGAFVPYSLSDRLLVLRRSDAEGRYRAQAHELLDDLAVPRHDATGQEHSLRARLTLLLGSLDGAPGLPSPSHDSRPVGGDGADGEGGASTGPPGTAEGPAATNGEKGGPDDVEESVAGPELVDALEAIQRAVQPEGGEDAGDAEGPGAPPPPPPPASPATPPGPDLIGLGSLLGTIQEELVDLRQAVESLREELRDAVALFQAGPGGAPVAPPGLPLVDGGEEIVVQRVAPEAAAPDAAPPNGSPPDGPPPDGSPSDAAPSDAAPSDAAPSDAAPSDAAPSEGGSRDVPSGARSADGDGDGTAAAAPPDAGSGTAVLPEVAGDDGAPDGPAPAKPRRADEPTLDLGAPAAESSDGPAAAEPAPEAAVPRRRSRRVVVLVLCVVVVGVLLAAAITAAVVVGWDELESRFLDTIVVPLWGGPAPALW